MDSGSLAEWYVEEGAGFAAGDAVAKIETDKASIDFEAQDDGYVARLLLEAGTQDVPVGTPIMITVEEEEHVAAFQDYVLPDEAPAPTPAPEVETSKEEKSAAPEPPAAKGGEAAPEAKPSPSAMAEAKSPPPPKQDAASPPPPAADTAVAVAAVAWGMHFQTSSPLTKTLATKQRAYVDAYGSTGQVAP